MAQISKFGLRMADFILYRIRSLSAVKPSHFYQGLAELQLYQGRPAAVAVLSSLGASLALASVIWALSFRDSHGKPAPSLARAPLF